MHVFRLILVLLRIIGQFVFFLEAGKYFIPVKEMNDEVKGCDD